MKKIYALIVGALICVSFNAGAQTTPRVVLFEEFTGENCDPCAGVNPYIKKFIDLTSTDSFIHIAYQSPIPSAGPIYNSYPTDANARLNYYSVQSAPWGEQDGGNFTVWPSWPSNNIHSPYAYFDSASVANYSTDAASVTPTSPGFTQERALNSPCTISITHSYSTNNDSIYAVAVVNTTFNFYASAHTNLKFQMALIENQLNYFSPPGTNGETQFNQVVRKLLPSSSGTQLVDTFLNGRTDTFRFALKIPSYVREKAQLRFVGFIQDNGTKNVKQAGISQLVNPVNLVEFLADHDSVPAFSCTSTSTSSIPSFVTVQNTGTVALTSLQVDVYSGTTSLYSNPWNGTLAPGASTIINAGPIAVPVGNQYPIIRYVLSKPNNQNSFPLTLFDSVVSNTQIFGTSYPAPIVQNFEDTTVYPQNNEYTTGEAPRGDVWYPSGYYVAVYENNIGPINQTPLGTEGTYNSIYFWNYLDTTGTTGDYYLQKADFTSASSAQMTFWHADKPYSGSNDLVAVQVSTDCGTTWTSAWSKSGSALATVGGANSANQLGYVPAAASDWVSDTVNLSAYKGESNVWIRFHAVSDYGDNVFVDQVNISQITTGINEINNVKMVSVYPNPTTATVNLSLDITQSDNFEINIVNILGETVKNVSNGELNTGSHNMDVNIGNLESGVYNFVIKSNGQSLVKRFVVAN